MQKTTRILAAMAATVLAGSGVAAAATLTQSTSSTLVAPPLAHLKSAVVGATPPRG